MALKRSFFSRLFGSSSAQEETAEESAEEQRQALPEEPPPLPDNSFLEIPPGSHHQPLGKPADGTGGVCAAAGVSYDGRRRTAARGQNWTGSWSG